MFALLSALFLTSPAQATPTFTIPQVIARLSVDMAQVCDFQAEDITERLASAAVFNMQGTGEQKGISFQIFELSCNRGAYNFNSVYYVGSDNEGLQLAQFAQPVLGGKNKLTITGFASEALLTNSTFTPVTGALGFYAKGRGLGDCFNNGMYRFSNGRFVLKFYETDIACDGKIKPIKIVDYK